MGVKQRKTKPDQNDVKDKEGSKKQETSSEAKSGIPLKRMLVRFILIVASVIIANIVMRRQLSPMIASAKDSHARVFYEVPCSKDYEVEQDKFRDCTPKKRCGRVVMDSVVTQAEAKELLRIAKSGLALGGSSGGASILDLHSGALSKGSKFVNIYSVLDSAKEEIFTDKDFILYRNVKNKIHRAIAKEFGVPQEMLYLTSPTFFSRMTTKPAKTIHDEYWHPHIDKETYGSFDYTSLLYLTTHGEDFDGGRFIFVDKDLNRTVEPKLGRLSFFTSGSENVHYVEKVTKGTRYAITVSFTCDKNKAITDPSLKR